MERSRIVDKMAMMERTTRSSTNVKPPARQAKEFFFRSNLDVMEGAKHI
jgi:hypothetical protein